MITQVIAFSALLCLALGTEAVEVRGTVTGVKGQRATLKTADREVTVSMPADTQVSPVTKSLSYMNLWVMRWWYVA